MLYVAPQRCNSDGCFDINQDRVDELNSGVDSTLEVANDELKEVIASTQDYDDDGLFITTNPDDLKACNFYIITYYF